MQNDAQLEKVLSMRLSTVSNRRDRFALDDSWKNKHKFLWSPSDTKMWLINSTSIVQSFPKFCLCTMADPSDTTSLIDIHVLPNGATFHADTKPHQSSGKLGIMLAESHLSKSIYCLPNGDCTPFNEPQNMCGLKLLALTEIDVQEQKENPNKEEDATKKKNCKAAPKKKTVTDKNTGTHVGKHESFTNILRQQTKFLLTTRGYPLEEINTHHNKVV